MVGARLIIKGILDELKPWNPYRIKRQMICRTRIVAGDGRGAQVVKRLQPCLEYRNDSLISLGKYASDLTGSIIQIEISRYLRLLSR